MVNNTLCTRQYIDATLIKPSKYLNTDIDEEYYQILRENVRQHNKVLEPVYVTNGLVAVSGMHRIHLCKELNIPLPIENIGEVSPEQEELLVLSHDLKRPLKHSERYRLYEAIRRHHNITPGKRTDLVANGKEYKAIVDKVVGNDKYISRYKFITENAVAAFNGDEAKAAKYLKEIDAETVSVCGAEKYIRAQVKKIVNKKVIPEKVEVITDWVKLLHKDSRLLTIEETGLVDAIVTSPHYGFGRIDYDNDEENVGCEKDVVSFTDAMNPFFKTCWNILKDDGSLWVVIGDCVRDGQYQNAPEHFLLMMLSMGWLVNDKIIWNKIAPQPTSEFNRTICSYEYIYHFTKSRDFVYNRNWINEIPDETITTLGHTETTYHLRSLVDKVKNSIITTNKSSTAAIKKKCEDHGFYCTHNATYPIDIPLYCILASTVPGDTVLDICTGTSVTGEAAVQVGRKFIGCDINNQYIQASKVRLEKYINEQTD